MKWRADVVCYVVCDGYTVMMTANCLTMTIYF